MDLFTDATATHLDTSAEARALLAAYHDQIRDSVVEGDEREGPLVRRNKGPRGFLTYRSVADVEDLDALITGQRDHFARLGKAVEWKHHGYDRPRDLPDRLVAAGFEPEDPETVVLGRAEDLMAAMSTPPDGVVLREITEHADLERMRAMEERVWNLDFGWLFEQLANELPRPVIVVAEADREVVSASWLRFYEGTEFGGLWGGTTLPGWRGKGIYRALVAHRARAAVERGYRYLVVDCTEDSRPILQRLGMYAAATTTPYVWNPPNDSSNDASNDVSKG